MKTLLLCLLAGLLIGSGTARSEDSEDHPIDVTMEKAMDADPSTGGQTQAIATALKQWDGELNSHYQTLTKELDQAAAGAKREPAKVDRMA